LLAITLAAFVSNGYDFPKGGGTLLASFSGEFSSHEANSRGGEFFKLTANASTFDNNTATAQAGPFEAQPQPFNIGGEETKKGQYDAGPGILSISVDYDAGLGRLVLPHSGIGQAEVPEPSSFALLGTGVLALVYWRRRRQTTVIALVPCPRRQ
jgi:hypothetical protein